MQHFANIQVDLRRVHDDLRGMPETAAMIDYRDFAPWQLMLEQASVTTPLGRYAVYLMYFGLMAFLSDKKLNPGKKLMNDLRTAYQHLPMNELKKLGFGKTHLVETNSVRWMRDQLPYLRQLNRKFAEMTRIPENERKLFTMALRISKDGVSQSSLKVLEQTAWKISPDLGGKVTSYLHGEPSDETKVGKKAATSELEGLHTALRAAVKALGGSGLTLSLDKVATARANPKLAVKYKEYLRLRGDVRKMFEIEFKKLIVNNGNEPVTADDAEKQMQKLGFELMLLPTKAMGYHGKVGIHQGKMALFTSDNKLLMGNVAPGSKVTMNRKYDSGDDNAYYMSVKAPGALGTARVYTADYKRKGTAAKFQKADDLSKTMPRLLAAWKRDLRSNDPLTKMHAVASVALYWTGARAGSNATGMSSKRGVAGFGMMNMRAKHVRVTATSLIFDYPGKKGVGQKHVIKLEDQARKYIAAFFKKLKANKKPDDPLWTLPGVTGKKDIVANYASLNRYSKTVGLIQGIHKLRHVRGTSLVVKLLAEKPWKPSKAATTMAKRKREADAYMKDKILSKVAELLGHRSTGRDGGTKLAWGTSIKSYVNPNVVRDWYTKQKLDAPSWLPERVEA